MPFKSEAQRRKFHQLVAEGKMSQETLNKWESETSGKLPDKATKYHPKKKAPRRMVRTK